jgi:hypothetical protein
MKRLRSCDRGGEKPAFFCLMLVPFLALHLAAGCDVSSTAPETKVDGYYVSKDGDDSYNGLYAVYEGGSNGPFRTLSRAARAVKAGDTVFIREGTYTEASSWKADGTEANPITITNYNGETVVIDGAGNTVPGDSYAFLFKISGDWYTVSNIEVRYSGGPGIGVDGGVHNTFRNIYAHHNYRTGIHGGGDYCTIEGCRAYWNSVIYEYGRGGSWSSGIALGRDNRHTTVRDCLVWNNWGQGINSGFDSLIEDNVSWDNMCSFYVNDAQGVVLQRNLAYVTPGNALEDYVEFQIALLVGDERAVPSRGNTIINNFAMGGMYVLSLGSGALEDCVIANNTLVNARNPHGDAYTLRIGSGNYANTVFQNNIIVQDDDVTIASNNASGIEFGRNNWSIKPASTVTGTGDIVGDPQLARSGPTGPGQLGAEWFKIVATSPAKDRALVLTMVAEDFFKTPRGSSPDIGAHELRTP